LQGESGPADGAPAAAHHAVQPPANWTVLPGAVRPPGKRAQRPRIRRLRRPRKAPWRRREAAHSRSGERTNASLVVSAELPRLAGRGPKPVLSRLSVGAKLHFPTKRGLRKTSSQTAISAQVFLRRDSWSIRDTNRVALAHTRFSAFWSNPRCSGRPGGRRRTAR
jgi:hypothetical protein